MSAVIRDCPFCGWRAESVNYITEAAVRCLRCFAKITRAHAPQSDTGLPAAISAWNERAMTADKAPAVGAVPLGDIVDRWAISRSDEHQTDLDPNGEYVAYEDYADALAERDARIAELEQDAARYRWLRSQGTREAEIDRALYETISDDHSPPYRSMKHGEALDAAIDKLRGEAG